MTVFDITRYQGWIIAAGGEGAHAIAWLDAMESWVEEGSAPGQPAGHPSSTASRRARSSDNAREFSRPVCQYPAVPVYDGSGDPDIATSSFSCVAP